MPGTGDNVYVVDSPDDVVDETGGDGIDTILGFISIDLTDTIHFKGDIENVTLQPGVGLNAKGDALANMLVGNSAGNTLDGGLGADFMRGLGGNDSYYVDDAGDVVDEAFGGSSGADTVYSTISVDLTDATRFRGAIENVTLLGGALNVTGNALNNVIIGNAANNTLTGGAGADRIDGGGGARDTASYRFAAAAVSLDLTKAVQSGGDAEGDRLTNIEDLVGSAFTDTLIGDAGDNWLDGGDGGADTLRGGLGNDAYFYRPTFVMDETGGSGTDTVFAGVSVNLSDAARFVGAIENAILTGVGDVNLTGNGLRNALLGNSGDNLLDGKGGIDMMRGFAGDDTYVVDHAGDVVDEGAAGSGGVDTIRTAVSIDLSDQIHVKGVIENVTVVTSANVSVIGSAFDNVLTGNAGNDFLRGVGGKDTLFGFGGNDTLVAGGGDDSLDGGAGADFMRGLGGSDHYTVNDAGDVVDEAFTGSGGRDSINTSISINLSDATHFKGAIEDINATTSGTTVVGNALNNRIEGARSGLNYLNGGLGNDTLVGNVANDARFVFDTTLNASTNVDFIDDKINLIYLDNRIFTALSDEGRLNEAFFKSTADGPIDPNDFIIYDAATGGLFYDVNGSGAGGRTRFATASLVYSQDFDHNSFIVF